MNNVIPFPSRGRISKPKRIFIVEDESLMALLVEDMLKELGYEIAGMSAYIDDALTFIDQEKFDLAILDINVRGMDSYEVADRLEEKGVPFIFSTGYDTARLLKPYRAYPTLQKPYEQKHLRMELDKLLGFPREKVTG